MNHEEATKVYIEGIEKAKTMAVAYFQAMGLALEDTGTLRCLVSGSVRGEVDMSSLWYDELGHELRIKARPCQSIQHISIQLTIGD